MAGPHVEAAVRELSRALLPESDHLAPVMADRIRAEIDVYRQADSVSVAALNASCADNLRYVLGNLAGTPLVDRQVPRATGAMRAEAGVPYAAVLQAYRIGGRFIWELLVERAEPDVRDVLLRAAADIWAVTDELSAQVTDAYRATLSDRARRDEQVRSALLGTLLDSDVTAAEQLQESAAVLHMPRHGSFVVVSAEFPTAGTEALSRIEDVLRRQDVVSAWRLDHHHQDGLITLRPRFSLADLIDQLTAVAHHRVGVSAEFAHIDEARRALRQARLACAAATPGSTELVRYGDRPAAVLLASSPDAAEAFTRAVLDRVLDLPADDRAVLVDTARSWLADEGSTSAAAEHLHLHRNTVRYRLRRFETLTGRSLTVPADLADVHLALEGARILGL